MATQAQPPASVPTSVKVPLPQGFQSPLAAKIASEVQAASQAQTAQFMKREGFHSKALAQLKARDTEATANYAMKSSEANQILNSMVLPVANYNYGVGVKAALGVQQALALGTVEIMVPKVKRRRCYDINL
jgi:hypothetical protein